MMDATIAYVQFSMEFTKEPQLKSVDTILKNSTTINEANEKLEPDFSFLGTSFEKEKKLYDAMEKQVFKL
ncbi:hypothetical protein [Maribacter sp. 2210JD10-5]|uniref:hypothetical protein n=1 Tax=Maribacter sp. 2210JD10-5 TaxID=3386272 RepID=UPI0039BCD2F5